MDAVAAVVDVATDVAMAVTEERIGAQTEVQTALQSRASRAL